ncbi:MAG: beta-ketoacyl-[acyl-carrier-protein] synthase family protein [Fibrobacter sp.]|nr:beta-ketoacyl-[acyl-carrier-protein] synthase family protein [Fibrobacter sp.]
MQRVVITGIAPIVAMGTGHAFFEKLMAMEPVIKPIEQSYCDGANISKWYVPYPEVDVTPYKERLRQMLMLGSRNAITAAVAALKATEDAGLKELDPETAVFFGGSTMDTEDILTAYNAVKEGRRLHPASNPKSMANAVPAWISILLGIHGRSQVIATACASGTDAIGAAYEHICMGKSKMAVCGGADQMSCCAEMMFRSFDVLGALTRSPDGLPCPFSEERSGFLYSEGGACVLILEEYESAVARGANIYAEITDYRSCCDAYHIVKMPDYPEQVISMFNGMVEGKKVDYYNAHGTATQVNDQMEATALKEVFGSQLGGIIINATKSLTGHSIGTSGALEAAVTAYSLKNGIVHGNIVGTLMEGLNLPRQTQKCDIRCAISASYGFGGHNSALMLEKV